MKPNKCALNEEEPYLRYVANPQIYRYEFGWVLRHVNHFRLFNAKSYSYKCIKYIEFGLVGF